MNKRNYLAVQLLSIVASFLFPYQGFNQETLPTPYFTPEISKWVLSEYTVNTKRYGNDSNYLVKKSLLADRKRKRIEILAIATGLGASEPVEFFIISEGGKDYEALSVSSVKPSDIIKALKFIGMKPGYPAEPRKNRFAAKGERVIVTFNWRASSPDQQSFTDESVRAELFLIDRKWNKPLSIQGLRFIGSIWQPTELTGTKRSCMADEYHEIAAAFNSQWAIFDVPHNAPQGNIYGLIQPNPEYLLEKGQRLRIVIQPEYTDGTKRIVDYILNVKSPAKSKADTAADLIYELYQVEGQSRSKVASNTFNQVIDKFHEVIIVGKEVYLKTKFDGSLKLKLIHEVINLISPIINKNLIVVEYNDSEIFHQAFLPDQSWRDPTKRGRSDQPIEIHISMNDTKVKTLFMLTYYAYEPKVKPAAGTNSKTELFGSITELAAFLKSQNHWQTNGVFVFIDANAVYEQLLDIYQPIRNQFPTLFVFLDENETQN